MINKNSVENSAKLFENCMKRYIMPRRKEIGPNLRGHEEKEVQGSC
jgi:hypothetical protein